LLFFYVLAFGVLLGAEFNAAIEQHKPAKKRAPRVLDPRTWQRYQAGETAAPTNGTTDGHGRGGDPTARTRTTDQPRIRP
jgi:hypothetical protein